MDIMTVPPRARHVSQRNKKGRFGLGQFARARPEHAFDLDRSCVQKTSDDMPGPRRFVRISMVASFGSPVNHASTIGRSFIFGSTVIPHHGARPRRLY
jgi:hypothetical protein